MEEILGRWYFVTPEGHAFFSLGATHAVECIRLDELNLFETKYGKSEERLAEFFLERFKDWGYNSSGYGPADDGIADSLRHDLDRRAAVVFGRREVAEYGHLRPRRSGTAAQASPGSDGPPHRNPYCLGYVFIDLPVWHPKPRRGESYCDFIRSLDAMCRAAKPMTTSSRSAERKQAGG